MLCMTVFLMSALISLEAQRTISGTVTDESGEPLIGVNVLVLGSNVGTVSDFDGSYSLSVPAGATQIQFSYTGYDRVVVDLGSGAVIDVVMGEGAILEDVVVTGYGTVKREDVTGAIATVNSEAFNRGSITSAQELLSGKVAGVSITTGGDPGGSSVIRIRGGSSLSATNDPLIILDGVPISSDAISGSRNFLNIINPNDIATFTVLKDASATAIYGSRASNGVIIITTKKGQLDRKIGVEYSGSVAISTIAETANVLSADAFRGMILNRFPDGHPSHDLLGNAKTDWQDEIFDNALSHDHHLNISGSISDLPYRVSLGYSDKDGLLLTDNFNRLTYGLNLSPGLLDNKLQINLSAKGVTDKNTFADGGAIGAAVFFDPTQPVRVGGPTDLYGGFFTWQNNDGSPNELAPSNPVSLLEMRSNKSTVNRYILGGQIDYRLWFLEDLRVNLNLGYDYSKGEGRDTVSSQSASGFYNGGTDNNYSQENKNELLEVYLDYASDISSDFNLSLMGGYSWQHFHFEDFSFNQELGTGDTLFYDAFPREYYLLSLFGRANLTLFDDFLLTFTLRRDGTSRFSEDNRWGTFPGAALAWKMVSGGAGTVNNVKLRLGYGLTGQQGISGQDYYPYLSRYLASFPSAQYQFGNQYINTLRPEGYDINIKWEETTTYNLGLDYGLWNDRLNGSIDVYLRKTKDLINFIPVPAGTNLTNFITTNVGDLENRGVELAINAVPWRHGRNEWSLGFNVAYNKNEITKLTATDDPNYQGVLTGGISGGVGNNLQIHSVGFPANSFFVYEQVYDAAGVPIEGLYVDRNGDGVFTPSDQYRYKKAAPDVVFGFYTSLDIGKLNLSAGARANVGNFVYNNNLSDQGVYDFIYSSAGGGTGYLNNVNAQTPAIDINSPEYFSDFYVSDGSFLRIDHITAAYHFGAIGDAVKNLTLTFTAQNPVLITGYDGIDPEVFGGIDNNIYPRSRTFLFGVKAGF
jgi:iron complex outermembrane receptor protein